MRVLRINSSDQQISVIEIKMSDVQSFAAAHTTESHLLQQTLQEVDLTLTILSENGDIDSATAALVMDHLREGMMTMAESNIQIEHILRENIIREMEEELDNSFS